MRVRVGEHVWNQRSTLGVPPQMLSTLLWRQFRISLEPSKLGCQAKPSGLTHPSLPPQCWG